MKRFIALACVLFALGILVWVRWRPMGTASPGQPMTVTPEAPPPLQDVRSAQGLPSVPAVPMTPGAAPVPALTAEEPAQPKRPPPLPYDDSPARQEAEQIALNMRHYGQRFGGNPEGTNAEIVKALNGGNAKGARYLPQENLRLNSQGELLDSFGTPYFFHQISSQEMEVRSAGPDRTLWTADDIAVK